MVWSFIFDLDGVILDSEKALIAAARQLYDEAVPRSVDWDDFWKFYRSCSVHNYKLWISGQIEFVEYFFFRIKDTFAFFGIEISNGRADELVGFHRQCLIDNSEVFDDVIPCLETLRGGKIGVITNMPFEIQWAKIEKLGLDRFFPKDHFFVPYNEEGRLIRKPCGRIYEKACRTMGVDAMRTVFIDDLRENAIEASICGMVGAYLDRQEGNDSVEEISCLGIGAWPVYRIYNLNILKKLAR